MGVLDSIWYIPISPLCNIKVMLVLEFPIYSLMVMVVPYTKFWLLSKYTLPKNVYEKKTRIFAQECTYWSVISVINSAWCILIANSKVRIYADDSYFFYWNAQYVDMWLFNKNKPVCSCLGEYFIILRTIHIHYAFYKHCSVCVLFTYLFETWISFHDTQIKLSLHQNKCQASLWQSIFSFDNRNTTLNMLFKESKANHIKIISKEHWSCCHEVLDTDVDPVLVATTLAPVHGQAKKSIYNYDT